jgi:hypothetical protein
MTNLPVNQTIRIADIDIRRDADGRFSLNDLHRAAGGAKRHQPSNWLQLDQTKELIDELRKPLILAVPGIPGTAENNNLEPVVTVHGGNGPQGTFVVKELVYAFGMWISPPFHLSVIRTFDATQPSVPGLVTDATPAAFLPTLLAQYISVTGPAEQTATRSISHLLAIAVGQATTPTIPATAAAHALAAHGLLVQPPSLLIANWHPSLGVVLAQTPWAAGWLATVRKLPGARRKNTVRFAAYQSRCTAIPLTHIGRLLAATAALPEPEEVLRPIPRVSPTDNSQAAALLLVSQQELLRMNRRWSDIVKCDRAGLNLRQTAAVVEISESQVSREKVRLRACGLLGGDA